MRDEVGGREWEGLEGGGWCVVVLFYIGSQPPGLEMAGRAWAQSDSVVYETRVNSLPSRRELSSQYLQVVHCLR